MASEVYAFDECSFYEILIQSLDRSFGDIIRLMDAHQLSSRSPGYSQEPVDLGNCMCPISTVARDSFVEAKGLTSSASCPDQEPRDIQSLSNPLQSISSSIKDALPSSASPLSECNFSERNRYEESKSAIQYTEVPRCLPSNEPPLTWINITHPTSATLHWLADHCKIQFDDLQRSLEEHDPPSGYRYGAYLILRGKEITKSEHQVTQERVLAICSNDYLITISEHPPQCVSRVWSELIANKLSNGDYSSSSALATRLFGSMLHKNELAVQEIAQRCNQLTSRLGTAIPNKEDLIAIRECTKNLAVCRESMEGFDNVLDRLGENENLFGAKHALEALTRYHGIIKSTRFRMEHCRQEIVDVENSWNSLNARWQNDILFKLAALSGLCTPIALVAQVLSIGFSNPLPDAIMTTLLGITTVISTALVAVLTSRKFRSEQ